MEGGAQRRHTKLLRHSRMHAGLAELAPSILWEPNWQSSCVAGIRSCRQNSASTIDCRVEYRIPGGGNGSTLLKVLYPDSQYFSPSV
jgi:hypothetical protein